MSSEVGGVQLVPDWFLFLSHMVGMHGFCQSLVINTRYHNHDVMQDWLAAWLIIIHMTDV
jgi:hypothetical protein